MNRLTERKENGVINVRYATEHETAIHRLASIEDILGDEYDLDKLWELAQADREGRCMVVPSDYNGEMFKIWKGQILSSRRFVNNIKELGKTVFLTREEAEAALRREQDD